MPKFRKKPVVIEAVRFDGTFESVEGLTGLDCTQELTSKTIQIETLEGVMTANPGDWIIRGVKGEFYPCKPDIFAATYEPVDETKEKKPWTPPRHASQTS